MQYTSWMGRRIDTEVVALTVREKMERKLNPRERVKSEVIFRADGLLPLPGVYPDRLQCMGAMAERHGQSGTAVHNQHSTMEDAMSLSEELARISEKSKDRIPEEFRSRMKQATEELQKSNIVEKAAGEGDALPAFVLPNQNGEMVSSADLLARGPLVLSFYRGSW